MSLAFNGAGPDFWVLSICLIIRKFDSWSYLVIVSLDNVCYDIHTLQTFYILKFFLSGHIAEESMFENKIERRNAFDCYCYLRCSYF